MANVHGLESCTTAVVEFRQTNWGIPLLCTAETCTFVCCNYGNETTFPVYFPFSSSQTRKICEGLLLLAWQCPSLPRLSAEAAAEELESYEIAAPNGVALAQETGFLRHREGVCLCVTGRVCSLEPCIQTATCKKRGTNHNSLQIHICLLRSSAKEQGKHFLTYPSISMGSLRGVMRGKETPQTITGKFLDFVISSKNIHILCSIGNGQDCRALIDAARMTLGLQVRLTNNISHGEGSTSTKRELCGSNVG